MQRSTVFYDSWWNLRSKHPSFPGYHRCISIYSLSCLFKMYNVCHNEDVQIATTVLIV